MLDALLQNGLLLLVFMLAAWIASAIIGKVSFVDGLWGLTIAALALLSFLSAESGEAQLVLMLMVVIWGVRLGVHLLRRFNRNGEDARYRTMLPSPDAGMGYAMAALKKVFLLQAALILLVSSPAQVGILAAWEGQYLPLLGWPGIALYAVGLFFEWVGDWQLARFKADPSNEGKVMDEGLWRYTRHPNYFGDACVWWGIFIVALSIAPGAVIWTLPGPLFLTFTLVKWSGAGMTEDAMRDKYGEDFARYAERTSAFIPAPPKRKEQHGG